LTSLFTFQDLHVLAAQQAPLESVRDATALSLADKSYKYAGFHTIVMLAAGRDTFSNPIFGCFPTLTILARYTSNQDVVVFTAESSLWEGFATIETQITTK
jgi:hypothetical protein